MKKLPPLLAALVIAPLLGSDSPKEYDGRTQMADLVGTWRLVKIKRGDQDGKDPAWEFVFRAGGTYSLVGPIQVDGTYKVDTGRVPGHLDLFPAVEQGKKAHRAIFRFDGDVLLIALFEPEDVRPRTFSDKNLKVLTLERTKK